MSAITIFSLQTNARNNVNCFGCDCVNVVVLLNIKDDKNLRNGHGNIIIGQNQDK